MFGGKDTIFLSERVSELPEVVGVSSRQSSRNICFQRCLMLWIGGGRDGAWRGGLPVRKDGVHGGCAG